MIEAKTGREVKVASKDRRDKRLATPAEQIRLRRAMEWYLDVVVGRVHSPGGRRIKMSVVDVAEMWKVSRKTVHAGIDEVRVILQEVADIGADMVASGYE